MTVSIVVLLLMSALLAASETALFSLVRMERAHERLSEGVRAALRRLLSRPLETLITVNGLAEAANVFAETLGTTLLIMLLGDLGPYVAVPVMLVLVLILCDITPKTFALGHPAGVVAITARPLAAIAATLHPLVRVLAPSAAGPRAESLSESEFKELLKIGEHGGEIDPQERALINRVFDFGARRVAEVMTPRDEMALIDVAVPYAELVAEIAQAHFSRAPVYRDKRDNIVGILHVKDLVAHRLDPAPPRLERLLRPANFVPPGERLGVLFDEMRRGRFQLALVVNEYGALLGLVTLEDLLEELFGEISDEFDLEVPELTAVNGDEWLASGAVEVSKLSALLGAEIPTAMRGGHTLSSVLLRRFGRVPHHGDKLRLGNFDAAVERINGGRVELVRLKRWTQ
ncbi:MAG: hemolysin family protein [Candidatus Binataceae bacterium]